MRFNIHTIYNQTFKIWRRKRFALFLRFIKPDPLDTVLDVGGHPGTWALSSIDVARVDILNIHEIPWTSGASRLHLRTLVGDGCSLAIADNSYNIGFSNSVIEHVGSWQRQQQFASELRRCAKKIWIQTPAYECPIEPHYLSLFVHYLPHSIQKRIVRWCTLWAWIQRPSQKEIDAMVKTTRLLRKSEMQQLFPDCILITERLLWIIPKSYIAVRTADKGERKTST